jgi:CubicO group peptidase (beta-lactamase class C family)
MKRTSGALCAVLLLAAFMTNASAILARSYPPKDLDVFAGKVLKQFEVPGMAVAIVKDGEVVAARGYGIRDTAKATPVDAHTLFAIASNTKAFTATALGILVEEGKLNWDDPVVDHLPWFQLSDPYVTREITVRDLLVHRSGLGLGQGDLLLWPNTTYDRKEIVRRLRHLPLKTSFRSAYAYDNGLYLAAGEIVEAVSGQPWEEFVAQRILGKLGMDDSKTGTADALAAADVAQPFASIEGKVRRIAPEVNENMAPAAGIFASAADMAKWLIVQLDSGRIAPDERLFSPSTTAELWACMTPIPIGDPPPELAALKRQFSCYGLGFAVWDYRGHKVVSHSGALGGYLSLVTMVPGLKLGIVVLTNQESEAASTAVTRHILDHYLKVSDIDWLAVLKTITDRNEAKDTAEEEKVYANRDSTSGPSLSISSYAGAYTDAWYGDIVIDQEQNGLVMRFSHTPVLVGDMEHWQHDTFIVRWRDREQRADAFVTFALNPDGSIDQARMKPVSPATDFSFDFQDLLLKPSRQGEK